MNIIKVDLRNGGKKYDLINLCETIMGFVFRGSGLSIVFQFEIWLSVPYFCDFFSYCHCKIP